MHTEFSLELFWILLIPSLSNGDRDNGSSFSLSLLVFLLLHACPHMLAGGGGGTQRVLNGL
jgi:hypothetical protein